MSPPRPARTRPLVVHVTTTDISLALLLGPQLRAFRDAGYDVVGVSAPGEFVPRLEADGIRHVPLRNATRSMAPHRDLSALAELVTLFRRLRPDIVHTHNPKPGIYGRLAAWLAGVPHVVNTVHGLYAVPEDPLPKRTIVYALERLAAACSDAELLQNPEDRPTLRRLRVPADRLHALGNGIDLDRFDPDDVPPGTRQRLRDEVGASPDDVVVGAVGRLVAEKGFREVFAAATALAASGAPTRFVVIGPDDPAKSDGLTRAERDAAERDGVVFLGYRDDVHDLYAAMDLFVLASYREGFPRAAMEAAAMGLPIVATDIRGCRQVVDDGATGLLVPPRDVHALTDAIGRLANDAALRSRLGAAGRAKAQTEFDQRSVIATTLEIYGALLRR